MTFWEFLDRRHERKFGRPYRPLDGKLMVGALFFLGYYALVYSFTMRDVPAANIPLMRDAMLVLGPPVGAIVGAIWRTDRRDEIQAQNTGEGFRTMREQAKATTAAVNASSGQPQQVEVVNTDTKPVPVELPVEPEFARFEEEPKR